MFLKRDPGARIVHDPRLTWNTLDIVQPRGGEAVHVASRATRSSRQKMREVDGVYGGEMSAHHYFRNFAYCDSGMIPWLLVTADHVRVAASRSRELVGERMRRFPASGEINRKCRGRAGRDRAGVEARYAAGALASITPTVSASSSRTGASTCALRTPSR